VRGARVCRGGIGKKKERSRAYHAFCLKFRTQIERDTQRYSVSANLSPDVVSLWSDVSKTDPCMQTAVNLIPLRDQEQLEEEHGIEPALEFPASALQQD